MIWCFHYDATRKFLCNLWDLNGFKEWGVGGGGLAEGGEKCDYFNQFLVFSAIVRRVARGHKKRGWCSLNCGQQSWFAHFSSITIIATKGWSLVGDGCIRNLHHRHSGHSDTCTWKIILSRSLWIFYTLHRNLIDTWGPSRIERCIKCLDFAQFGSLWPPFNTALRPYLWALTQYIL